MLLEVSLSLCVLISCNGLNIIADARTVEEGFEK
jgi:hypothetical protein